MYEGQQAGLTETASQSEHTQFTTAVAPELVNSCQCSRKCKETRTAWTCLEHVTASKPSTYGIFDTFHWSRLCLVVRAVGAARAGANSAFCIFCKCTLHPPRFFRYSIEYLMDCLVKLPGAKVRWRAFSCCCCCCCHTNSLGGLLA